MVKYKGSSLESGPNELLVFIPSRWHSRANKVSRLREQDGGGDGRWMGGGWGMAGGMFNAGMMDDG